MERLFTVIRDACDRVVWSRGVELARSRAVMAESGGPDQATFRITDAANPFAYTVRLFFHEDDWLCNCGSDDDPCRHVAAAVIFLRHGAEGSQAGAPATRGPQAPKPESIVYHLRRDGKTLALTRAITSPDGARKFLPNSPTRVDDRSSRALFTKPDMEIDLLIGEMKAGRCSNGEFWQRTFTALADVAGTTLDGSPIETSSDPVACKLAVRDEGAGVRVKFVDDPAITERFENGAVLLGGRLRPLLQPKIRPHEEAFAADGQYFGPREFAALASEILPELEKRHTLSYETNKIARATRAKPMIEIHATASGNGADISAAIVYGDPPVARLEDQRFVCTTATPVVRDIDAELALRDRLWRELKIELGATQKFFGADALAICQKLALFDGRVVGDAVSAFTEARVVAPSVSVEEDSLTVTFHCPGRHQQKQVEAARVIEAWRSGDQLVPLIEGGWARLPADWLTRFGDQIADLLAARDENGRLAPAHRPALVSLARALNLNCPTGLLSWDPNRKPKPGSYPPPADLTATLRRYQAEGIAFLSFLKENRLGALLADDMGLGKTLQALCVCGPGTLVAAPTSVLQNWVDECRRFRPALSVAVFHGAGRELSETADVIVTSHAILRLDNAALSARRWNLFILDEAQFIKNFDSQLSGAARNIPAAFRVALSGTPIENSLADLFAIFSFILPNFLGSQEEFGRRFSQKISSGDATASQRLVEKISPFVLRRRKADVAPDLPPRTDVVLRVELSERERAIYQAVLAAAQPQVLGLLAKGSGTFEALELILRLRQACCHPGLLPGSSETESSKTAALMQKLSETVAAGHRAIVFSQWTSMLDLLEPHLKNSSIGFLRLDGSTRDRATVIRSFQTGGEESAVLLCSLKAGGTGLNLTAADTVFIVDPWWNPAAEEQAADRAHRIGQTRPVLVNRLVAADSIEERVVMLQQKKKDLTRALLEGASGNVLSHAELLSLLH